jgi:two-component system, OmpR family, phosphate regulon sensor histidine kinase PhoR
MFTRRLPITLGVVMILLLVVLIIGWVLLAVLASEDAPAVSWTVLSIGTVFYALLLVGVSLYLALSIKAVNLNRRQSNFIDSVTHELKSPIASMKLYLQTLNRHQVSPEQQADFHRAMLEDIERLDQLTDQMLDAGRLETNERPENLEQVPLGPVLRECAETARLRYHAAADAIGLDLEPCTLRARRVDLEVIFRNLLDNAVKYAGDPPRVQVTLRSDGNGRVIVRVCDNGRGVPYGMRRKIFGRFVRLGSELERDRPGTGLGLYIVRTLVRRLHGRVDVQDPPAGSGSVFQVVLPGNVSDDAGQGAPTP